MSFSLTKIYCDRQFFKTFFEVVTIESCKAIC